MEGYDDPPGVIGNMGIRPSRFQLLFTMSAMVSTINAVVGGSAVALLLSIVFDYSVGVAASVGAAFAALSLLLTHRWERRLHIRGGEGVETPFPSPQATA
jgi:uncharacterized membrane protein YccC